MGTKKKAKAEPVGTPAATDQPVLAVGMIWTDPRDGQKYKAVSAGEGKGCKGCHFFETEADCPAIDESGSPVCETASDDDPVKFEKIAQDAEPVAHTAPAADFDQVPKSPKASKAKGKAKAAEPVPVIASLTTCQRDIPAANMIHAAWNKRGVIEPEDVADLVTSIKAMGLIQRIVVRADAPDSAGDRYVILAGHMRYEACRIAGLEPIPCDVVECDDKKAHMITAVENMHRKNLSVMQEAEVVEDLINVGHTAEEVSAETGWHLRTIYRRANLRALEPKWRNAAYVRGLSGAFLEELARLPSETQKGLFEEIDRAWYRKELFASGGDVDRLKRIISDLTKAISKAPWSKKHPEWCANCERCSNANPNLFDETEVGEDAICLDPVCWAQRKDAMVEELKAELKAKHGEIKTATGDQYRYQQIPNTKGRKDKDHSVPVLITDGEAAGKVLWVAGAADKKAAKERGDTVSTSKQPSLAEKRQAWVIRKVRDMLDASRQTGSLDNPFLRFHDSYILQTVALTGTEHSSSWHKAKEWEGIESQLDEDIKVKLWGRVAPVLIARMNYPTITDCGPYYEEAVTQALWLFAITQTDLDAEAAEAIKDKSKKGAK